MKNDAVFDFRTNHDDVEFMQGIIHTIYDYRRIAALIACFAFSSIVLSCFIKRGNEYLPLLVFCIAVSFVLLLMLLSMMEKRPKLLESTRKSEGNEYRIVISGPTMIISINKDIEYTISSRDILNQFWHTCRYVLFFRAKDQQQMVCIPVNEDTFDAVFALAKGLELNNRKRLVMVSAKKE